jgi:hypothetical protein
MNRVVHSVKTYLPLALLACAALLLWVGFRLAPQLSALDQLHLLTSLAYLFLLMSAGGLRMVLRMMSSQPLTPLHDGLILLLGYALPGVFGWLPSIVLNQPFFASWQAILTGFSNPDLLWIPATQAAALVLLAPHTAAPQTHQARASAPLSVPAALLSGMGLAVGMAFLWQLGKTPLSPELSSLPFISIHWMLAVISSIMLAFFSERFLRGRLQQRWMQTGAGSPVNLAVYAGMAGLLTLRPFTVLPAALASLLFVWLANRENGMRSSILGHLAFNLSAVLLNTHFIH